MKKVLVFVADGTEEVEVITVIDYLRRADITVDFISVLEGKNFTCYPGFEEKIKSGNFTDENVVVDGNVITGKGPAIAASLAFKLIEELVGKEKSDEVREGTLYNLI